MSLKATLISFGAQLKFASLLFTVAAIVCLSSDARGKPWRLTWHDEFNGKKGAGVDQTKWSAEIGGSGWGNRELEYYTSDDRNAYLDGRGSLVIKAIRETLPQDFKCWYGQCLYTSARLSTKRKFAQAFGRFEARLKLPLGQGVWPAFWMLGEDIDAVHWPTCGEIDVMENIGREPNAVHGTIHGPGYSGSGGLGAPFTLAGGKRFADDFHTFAVEWEPKEIRWYVDGKLYETRVSADLPAGTRWVYDHPFFVILNLAIGGSWPGDPDGTTAFPQTLLVDYVRVYRR
ncbi:MAG TPA: glycoside hydrolase family 16 protein [Pyrinomonadaceae bacterium]|nr:glycoside hydrolase family 16 protein [Pyrinomonadaceae bacterium]